MIFLLGALLFLSCEKTNTPSGNDALPSNSGNVAFTLDKANAPAAVKSITSTLTRSGYATLTKTLNIDSDTSATILFTEVAVGTWRVKVDAKDESGKLLYTGEADVIVLESTVTQLSLTLNPVSTGVGSVQINVTWGSGEKKWTDYVNNPVLVKTGKAIDWGGVGQPKIYFDNGVYRMYYLNYSFPSPVSYAESMDGINWERPDTLPVIVVGPSGSWDDGGTGPGPVYKVGSKYYMLYQGYDAPTKHFKVGLAESVDGRHWVKHPIPVFTDSLSWEYNIVACDVEVIGNTYFMYYTTSGKIGLATSTDGQIWKRYSPLPVLESNSPWEMGGISFPSVYKDGEIYKMVYMSNSSDNSQIAFGLAVSSDGKNWIKDGQNPIFKKSQTSNQWASHGIIYPFALKMGNQQRMYYTGVTSNEWKIGFADFR